MIVNLALIEYKTGMGTRAKCATLRISSAQRQQEVTDAFAKAVEWAGI